MSFKTTNSTAIDRDLLAFEMFKELIKINHPSYLDQTQHCRDAYKFADAFMLAKEEFNEDELACKIIKIRQKINQTIEDKSKKSEANGRRSNGGLDLPNF